MLEIKRRLAEKGEFMNSKDSINEAHINCRINGFGTKMRDLADKDYILSRFCYFNGFHENFFWHAQQSIEKYLKSIGLFRKINTKKYGHDLNELYKRIQKKELIDVSKWHEILKQYQDPHHYMKIEDFLKHIGELGLSGRYPSEGYAAFGTELIKLDLLIFLIRKRCIASEALRGDLKNLNNRISGGYLEKIIEGKLKRCSDEQKKYLAKQNRFFSENKDSRWNYNSYVEKGYIELVQDSNYPEEVVSQIYCFLLKKTQLGKKTKKYLDQYFKKNEDACKKCGLFSEEMENDKKNIKGSEELKKAFNFIKKVQSHKMSLKIPLKDEEKQDLRPFLINSLVENVYFHFLSVYQLSCYGLCFESKILIRSMIENLVNLKRMVQEKDFVLKYMIYSKEKEKNSEKIDCDKDVEKEIDDFLNKLNAKSDEEWTKKKVKKDCEGFMKQIEKLKDHDPEKNCTSSYGECFANWYKNLCSLVHGDLSITYRQLSLKEEKLKIKKKNTAEPIGIKDTLLLSGLFLFYSVEEAAKALKIQLDQISRHEVINALKELLRDFGTDEERIDEISKDVSELIFF